MHKETIQGKQYSDNHKKVKNISHEMRNKVCRIRSEYKPIVFNHITSFMLRDQKIIPCTLHKLTNESKVTRKANQKRKRNKKKAKFDVSAWVTGYHNWVTSYLIKVTKNYEFLF